mmetsp:Transcript_4278/g.5190  ORF Transcript_4278/g.5190 Transcript_4278/m.5190 type:complete len:87 (+) Transcript_4278:416-676(+)
MSLEKASRRILPKRLSFMKRQRNKDNCQAMSNLGYLYYTKGKFSSSEQHFESAAYWLRKSLLKEYELKDSHYYLGLMHQNGEGVDQ